MNWLRQRIIYTIGSGIGGNTTDVPDVPDIPDAGTLRYRFGIISDAHQSADDSSPYTNGVVHLGAALNNLYSLGAQEIISCGDSCARSGTETEWQTYVNTLTQSPFTRSQVHECNGNHDGAAPDLTLFKQYANNGTRVGNTPYFSIDLYGDHFIFMALDQSTTPSGSEVFSDAQMEWLEKEIKAHYGVPGKNLWIVEHALFYGWGTGDIMSSPKYGNALNMNNANNFKLKQLMTEYEDMIFLHGHSHI
jgi:predicted phosphodiesterase